MEIQRQAWIAVIECLTEGRMPPYYAVMATGNGYLFEAMIRRYGDDFTLRG